MLTESTVPLGRQETLMILKLKKEDGSLAINVKDKYAKDFSTGEKVKD